METLNLSGREIQSEPWWRRLLWPELANKEDCIAAANAGSKFAYAIGVLTMVLSFAMTKLLAEQAGIVIEGLLVIGLGYGISRMSRVCAVLLLILYAGERIAMKNVNVVGVLATAAFISSVRACWKYHKLRRTPPPLPAMAPEPPPRG
ncbi:MAG: hypothetical protein U0Q16_11905 [Bryobacteraceae bacterium]